MKVLLLANHTNFGGITAYMLSLCRAMHGAKGVEFFVGSRGGDLKGEFLKLGVTHFDLPVTTKCEASPKVFLSFLKLFKWVKSYDVDVIHANTRLTQVLAKLLSQSTGRPYISTCHGYFKRRFSRRLFPCWGEKVIAISDQVRDHLIDDFQIEPMRIALIYNGVDLARFSVSDRRDAQSQKKDFGLDLNKKVIGHIGRLSSVKGQKYLILAAGELKRKRDDFQLFLVGSGDQEKMLKTLVYQNNLADLCVMHPSVKDTARALNVMDVFVMPSLQEGLGISILEAQAGKVPVVASRVGGIPAVVEDGETGLLCPSGDAGALARAIARLLDDQILKESIIEKGRCQIEQRFSLRTMAEKTFDVYNSLKR